jgi:hypothetical protein
VIKNLIKKWLPVLLIFFLTILLLKSYTHAGFPYTHDGENHLARFANYVLAIREGQLPPRFAPNLFEHFGYPVFDFNYPLANILSLPFSFAHVHYELTFKLLAFAAVLFGFAGVWFWISCLPVSRSAIFFTLGVSAVNPYLINALLFRGNIGEVFAVCLFPWLLFSVEQVKEKPLKKNIIISLMLLGCFAAFLLAHNIAAIFGVPVVFFYATLRLQKNILAWKRLGLLLSMSVLLTLWFWLPAVMEKSVTVIDDAALNTQFAGQFSTLTQLFFAPLRFGFSYVGSIDSLSFSLGLIQLIVLIVGSFYWLKNFVILRKRVRGYSITLALLLCACWLLVFGQLQVSQPIWYAFSFVSKYLQFPWRLAMFFQVLILPIAALTFDSLSKSWRFFLSCCLLLQIIAYSRLRPVDYFHRDIRDYDYFTQSTSTLNENRVRAFTFENFQEWQPGPKVLSGSAEFSVNYWRGGKRSYIAKVTQPTIVVEETMNFLGWQTWTTEKDQKNAVQRKYIDSKEIGGRIAYELPAGEYLVKSEFTQFTPARLIGNTVSVGAFLVVGAVGLQRTVLFLKDIRKKKK